MALILRESGGNEKVRHLKVDPTVAVRFDYLMGTSSQLSDADIDLEMRKMVQKEGAAVSLNNMIKGVVREFAYTKARLSLAELVQRFQKQRLAMAISKNFTNSLLDLDTDPRVKSEEEFYLTEDAQAELEGRVISNVLAFLRDKGLTSAVTLYQFLEQQKRRYPMICFSELFSKAFRYPEEKDEQSTTLTNKVAEQIDESFPVLAAAAYLDKFQEDKRGFVMNFMMGRVIKYDPKQRATVFDTKEFGRLMKYLDSVGANVVRFGDETLYDWLYAESRQMKSYIDERRVESERFGVRDDLARAGAVLDQEQEKKKPFFSNDFNVRDFYSSNIMPAVFKFYSKKKAKVTELEDVDLLHDLNDVNNVGLSNYTFQLTRYLKDLLRTGRKNPKVFMAKFREMFGFTDIPATEKKINQKHVDEFIAVSFRRAKIKFNRIMEQGLRFRHDEQAAKLMTYPREILDCEDLLELIDYVLHPEEFQKKYPKYANMPKYRIAFAASAFLMDFLKTSKKMVDEDFLEAEERRRLSEENMVRALQIKERKSMNIPMRVVECLDDNGKEFSPSKKTMVFDANGIEEFAHIMKDREMADFLIKNTVAEDEIFVWKGAKYRVLPIEKKKFEKVKMVITYHTVKIDEKTGERIYVEEKREVVALIYSGDGNLVHLKDEYDRMITDDRGKEISDECRAMVILANPEDEAAFRKFQLTKQIRGVVKVDDHSRGRSISTKSGLKHEKASAAGFKENERFKTAKKYIYPELVEGMTVDKEGKKVSGMTISTRSATVEYQVHGLDTALIYNLSKYTQADHDKYRAKRAWPLLFKYYFPPYIFGDEYKILQDQGIYGGKK